jgi:hypothetical protein
MKYDKGKSPIALFPAEVISEIAEIFAFGAEKYGANNWRIDGPETPWDKHYSSIQRHLLQFWSGEDYDKESGKHHLLHAMTQLIIAYVATKESPKMDNRWKNKND